LHGGDDRLVQAAHRVNQLIAALDGRCRGSGALIGGLACQFAEVLKIATSHEVAAIAAQYDHADARVGVDFDQKVLHGR
jgi:hypothetical protein